LAGILKQLCVLAGAQGPALTVVVADIAVMATARAVAIQALICVDDGRIDDRAGGHFQSLRRQMPLHFVEQLLAQIVRFEQVMEAAHRGFVGHRLAAEVDPDKAPHCSRIAAASSWRIVQTPLPPASTASSPDPTPPIHPARY